MHYRLIMSPEGQAPVSAGDTVRISDLDPDVEGFLLDAIADSDIDAVLRKNFLRTLASRGFAVDTVVEDRGTVETHWFMIPQRNSVYAIAISIDHFNGDREPEGEYRHKQFPVPRSNEEIAGLIKYVDERLDWLDNFSKIAPEHIERAIRSAMDAFGRQSTHFATATTENGEAVL